MKKYIEKIRNININKKKALICLIFLLIVISNSYIIAKYNSSIQSSGNVNVAHWKVNVNTNGNESNALNIISENTTADYEIEVSSTSEVALTYSIVLSNVPNGLEVKLDNANKKTPTNNIITFDNVGAFVANGTQEERTRTHTLNFNDPLNTNNSGTKEINIDVVIDQID